MFAGIMLLLLNVGGRFITHELSYDDREYSENIILRRLAIFAVCFVGTKDMLTSIVLTAAFVVLAGGIFRGKGPFSREGMKNLESSEVVSSPGNPYDGMVSGDPPLFPK